MIRARFRVRLMGLSEGLFPVEAKDLQVSRVASDTADDRDKLPAIVAHLRIDRDEKSRTAHVAKRLKLSKHQRIYLRHSAGLGNIAVRAEHAAAIVLAL